MFSEKTKIGCVDEADINLDFDEKVQKILKENLEFNEDLQSIEVKGEKNFDIPEELEAYNKYLLPHGPVDFDHMGIPYTYAELDHMGIPMVYYKFDIKEYFQNFIRLIHEVVSNPEFSFEGVRLSTKFIHCQICKNNDQVEPMYVRCMHQPDCKVKDQSKHIENCDCQVYTSPCLTHSKIGAVLHLQFDAEKCNVHENYQGCKSTGILALAKWPGIVENLTRYMAKSAWSMTKLISYHTGFYAHENDDPIQKECQCFLLDVDLSPPNLPVRYTIFEQNEIDIHILILRNSKEYDGDVRKKRKFLEENTPVFWLKEWKKFKIKAEEKKKKKESSVRLRLLNREYVLAEQVK